MMNKMVDYAQIYAARGWPVLPLRPRGKEPLTAHGVKDATTDASTIRAWWQRWPDANIGIATGAPSGLLVVDVDPRHGGDEALHDLERQHGPMPESVESLTGGGGQHVLFRCPNGQGCGKLAEGIDVKADGGYIVAPPSIHPNGHAYVWEVAHRPEDVPLAAPPAWLLSLLNPAERASRAAPVGTGGRIGQGARNTTLTSLAGAMRRKGLSQAAIEAALLAENAGRCDPPLTEAEVKRIAASVARYDPQGDAEPEPPSRDYGHATALASLWRDRYRWAAHRGTWMAWTGQRWEPATEQQTAAQATADLRAHYAAQLAAAHDKSEVKRLAAQATETCNYARIQGALSFLKGFEGFHTDAGEWDADPWALNVGNGTVDLRSQTLRPHAPADLCTKLAPVDYDARAQAPAWEAHLAYFLPDADVRRQVQRDLGLSMVGAGLEERLPLWYGLGANGKSTTARTIQGVLGDYAAMAAPNLLVARRNEQHPTEIADLVGRRCVFSSEVSSAARLDEAKVKMLTGGDRQKGRYMRQDFFEFDQSWTITLFCNHKPTITGTDSGIWRRLRLVPWTVAMPKEKQMAQDAVIARLLAEAPGILGWLLEGLADWRREPHWMAEAVSAATESYRSEQDRLAGFLGDSCELGPHFTVAVGELYDAYARWCEEAGEEPLGKRAFGERLRDRGAVQRKGDKGLRLWGGVRIKRQVAVGGKTSGSSGNHGFLGNEPEHLPPSATQDELTERVLLGVWNTNSKV